MWLGRLVIWLKTLFAVVGAGYIAIHLILLMTSAGSDGLNIDKATVKKYISPDGSYSADILEWIVGGGTSSYCLVKVIIHKSSDVLSSSKDIEGAKIYSDTCDGYRSGGVVVNWVSSREVALVFSLESTGAFGRNVFLKGLIKAAR